jgi:hypothetical protein
MIEEDTEQGALFQIELPEDGCAWHARQMVAMYGAAI